MRNLTVTRLGCQAKSFCGGRTLGDSAVRAAMIKVETGIPYVDSFGLELAGRALNRVFVTADFDFKPASREVAIEFLPVK